MRISIIGHSGSGKSTVAQAICTKFNIAYLDIDRLWFEAGGNDVSNRTGEAKEKVKEYIRAGVEEFIAQDSWVCEGWYGYVQPSIAERADQIIFLDISLPHRLLNHWRRIFKDDRHPELTKWQDFKFTYQIIRRTFVNGPRIQKFITEHPEKVITLRSYKQIEKYLANLK